MSAYEAYLPGTPQGPGFLESGMGAALERLDAPAMV